MTVDALQDIDLTAWDQPDPDLHAGQAHMLRFAAPGEVVR